MGLPGKAIGGVMSLFTEKRDVNAKEWNVFQLTKQQFSFISQLSNLIVVLEEKKSNVILVDVKMQDPMVSAQVADSVVSKLESYMINYKTEKSRNDLDYALKLYNEAQERYFEIQKQYAQYDDANKNVVSAKYAIEKGRLQNEMTLAFSVYNGLAQQVEMAKAKVQQDTPVITVLEPAKVSLQASRPNKKLIIVLFSSLIFILSGIFVIVEYLFSPKRFNIELF